MALCYRRGYIVHVDKDNMSALNVMVGDRLVNMTACKRLFSLGCVLTPVPLPAGTPRTTRTAQTYALRVPRQPRAPGRRVSSKSRRAR